MFERDKNELRELGIPLETELDRGPSTTTPATASTATRTRCPPLHLTTDEMTAVALAARVWREAGPASPAARALLKLRPTARASSPTELPAIEPRLSGGEAAFEPLTTAVATRRPVSFGYRTARDVEPTRAAPAALGRRLPARALVRRRAWTATAAPSASSGCPGSRARSRPDGARRRPTTYPPDVDLRARVHLRRRRPADARPAPRPRGCRPRAAPPRRPASSRTGGRGQPTGFDARRTLDAGALAEEIASYGAAVVVARPAGPAPGGRPAARRRSPRAGALRWRRGRATQLARLLSLVPWLQAQPGRHQDRGGGRVRRSSTDQLEKDLQLAFTCELPGPARVFIDIDYLDSDRVSVIDAGSIDRPLRLRADEAVALLVGLRSLAAVPGLQDRAALDSALAKIEDAAGARPSTRTGPAGTAAREAPAPRRARTRRGAPRRRSAGTAGCTWRYWVPSRDEVTERDVDPYPGGDRRRRRLPRGLLLRLGGGPHLPAGPGRRTPRSSTSAADPPGAPRAATSRACSTPRPRTPWSSSTSAPEARWVPEYYACESVVEPPEGAPCGSTLRTGRPPAGRCASCCAWGAPRRVVEPAELAAEVRRSAAEALAAYGVPPGILRPLIARRSNVFKVEPLVAELHLVQPGKVRGRAGRTRR